MAGFVCCEEQRDGVSQHKVSSPRRRGIQYAARKARAEPIVERQHIVLLGLAPPQLYHRFKPLGLSRRAYVMESGAITLSGPAGELAHDPKVIEAYLGGEAA